MKKILIIILAMGFITSCSDLTDLNDNPKRAKEAPAGTLFANAQKNLSDILASSNVNRGIFRLLAQQWTETTYTNESRYDLTTRNIPQNFWGIIYRDVLVDLEQAKKTANAVDPLFITEEERTNQISMIEIMEVYAWSVLVDTFGDIPYKGTNMGEALDINNPVPKYEDAAAIYDDLILRLNTALAALDNTADNFGSSDLLYEGDVDSWLLFGNSLKLKLGLTLSDVNVEKAKTIVKEAVDAGVFTSADQNASIKYKDTPPNTNPVWVDLVQSGRKDFVAANTIVNAMTALDDPRLEFYFSTVDTLVYSAYEDGSPAEDAEVIDTLTVFYGGRYGMSNSFSRYSKPSSLVKDPTFEGMLLDYTEVEFDLAEAAARGFDVQGTAEEHYNAAVTASMQYWGVSDEDIADYLTKPEVAYGSPGEDWRQKIGSQKWLALYNRGFEAWREWRRLDSPELKAPSSALTEIPVRFTYPVNEQNLNRSNYNAATAKIGGDNVETRVFWDVK